MYFYFLFYLFSIFGLLIDPIKKREIKSYFVFLFIVLYSLVIGFRIGVKPDWYNYQFVFANFDVDKIFDYSAYSKEPGYMILNVIARFLNGTEFMMFMLVALISLFFSFLAYYRLSPKPFICILIYTSFFFINRDMGAIRAGVCYSIFLFSLLYLYDYKLKKYYAMVVFSSLFHITGILGIVVPLLYKIFNSRNRLFLILIFSIVFYFSDLSFYILKLLGGLNYISIISNKANAYAGSSELVYEISFFDLTNIKNLFISFIGLFFFKTISNKCKYFNIILFVFIVGTSFRIAFSDLGVIAGRGYAIFNTVEPILLSYFYFISNTRYYKIFYYISIVLYGLLFLFLSIYKYKTFPYINYIFSAY
ncbi:EpsG family protein [Photobacterium leiognathi]|uniref:EpsG family protein n=1 Tax=Photobacterium leiognathi TaxID=553611 RepID=UPI002981A1F0|nr:EpsG family protein [Photobacterium leiognathi]